jgi:hypothetical protein
MSPLLYMVCPETRRNLQRAERAQEAVDLLWLIAAALFTFAAVAAYLTWGAT